MKISIVLEHFKGHWVANIPGETPTSSGTYNKSSIYIGPIIKVHWIPEFETNHWYVQCLPPEHFIQKSVIEAGPDKIFV